MIFVASIFNAKTRFLVVDIETIKQDNSVIFDISFGIFSRKEGKIGSMGYIVAENQTQIPYYADRLERYKNYIDNGKYQVRKFADIMAIMAKIVDKYKPQFVSAYNLNFDIPRIENKCRELNIKSPFANLEKFCIWFGACETIGQQKGYKRFTIDNGFFSDKGNRQSGAEIMYRYLQADPQFVEEHTGLADLDIEMDILDRVLRQKKPLSKSIGSGAWKLVQGA